MTNKSDENWCLVCSGSVFGEEVLITGNKAEKLRQQFHKVLKAHVPKKPPVDNICKKCDRIIRRLADSTGETAEREIEYMRKTYRKTVKEYNAKADLRRQKLRKAAEAFILGKPKDQKQTGDKLSIYASKWKFLAKSGTSTSKILLPDSSGSSSPSWSKPASGETTPILDFKQNWVKHVEFHTPVEDSYNSNEDFTMKKNPDNVNKRITPDKNSNESSDKQKENFNSLNKLSTRSAELYNISDKLLDSLKEKSYAFHENFGKLVGNTDEGITGILKENVNNHNKNFDMPVKKSAKFNENADVSDIDFEKSQDDDIMTTTASVAKYNELNKNSDKPRTYNKSNKISEKWFEKFSESNINSNKLKDSAIPPEAKVALIEKEDGGENSVSINIGGKTAEDGVKGGVKEENVKLNVKDGGVDTTTEGGDVSTANTDVNTSNADGGVVSIDVATASNAGGDAGSKDEKKNEKVDEKKSEETKNDAKTDDARSEIKEEKVRSVKDAIKEIEGEDGGEDKSTVNGTVMKSEKTSVKGGSAQGKEHTKEKSPLIEKESNVKDTGPGVLCCNIL